MANDVSLNVNGKAYSGWERIRITRGIETISGSFDLSVSDRWNGRTQPWPIVEEDRCTVKIGNTIVITGYVDRRSLSYSAEAHTLSVSGRDKTGELVDCSAVLDKWEYIGLDVVGMIAKIAGQFGIAVSLQPGVTFRKPPLLTIDPGESAFDVIDRICRLAGLLPVSNGKGGLILTRAGTSIAPTQLIEGQNIKAGSADYDASGRYGTYKAIAQMKGSDESYGNSAAFILATAQDAGVRRTERVLIIRPEGGMTTTYAQQRAQWEATVRAARGASISITVQGWTQPDGTLWPINALVPVNAPMLGIKGTLLISQAVYSLDESGTLTELTLRRPDAFKPEPMVPIEAWKELGAGV